jgi:aspartyl-tRNA(Asn)/glutamyl-tRNA(Gln) amidotransferase subunit C
MISKSLDTPETPEKLEETHHGFEITQIAHMAKLSKLKFTPEEMAQYAHRFEEIMKMIDVISEVDTQGISPMPHPFDQEINESTMRLDQPAMPRENSQNSLILTSPEDPYFYVPKVIE